LNAPNKIFTPKQARVPLKSDAIRQFANSCLQFFSDRLKQHRPEIFTDLGLTKKNNGRSRLLRSENTRPREGQHKRKDNAGDQSKCITKIETEPTHGLSLCSVSPCVQ
jgi:hypothetical protein